MSLHAPDCARNGCLLIPECKVTALRATFEQAHRIECERADKRFDEAQKARAALDVARTALESIGHDYKLPPSPVALAKEANEALTAIAKALSETP